MDDLLEAAVAAHGGLDRWNRVKSITVDGIVIPSTRRAYASEGDDQLVMVAIDMGKITIR